ncbi:GNAT family N-acetyltransferase [Legionella sp. D16C41]|uniref:GNAT family N-acetyltransferase n=1 Tax=Legionella sp. D16C41 TaxID=3402688 RepID=UPI003AF42937
MYNTSFKFSMITLKAYNPNWKIQFQEEKTSLFNLGIANIIKIEHIGSTAIKGILAKPVIDILIGVNNLNTFTTTDIQQIESLGYRYNDAFETIFPFRRYFQKENSEGIRSHQIHLVNYPSQWYERHILFRNYLRHYSNIAKEYEALKVRLAKQFDNTIDYANAKSNFCQEIDKRAFMDFKINSPFLESERLLAFIPQLACYNDYAFMLNDAEFCQVYGVSYTYEDALLRLQSDITYWNQYAFAPFMWYDKKTHDYVGRGGLKLFKQNPSDDFEVELTYQIKRDYWNQGFAEEIGRIAINYAFNVLSLSNIICFTAYNNYPSLKVMKKLGFIFEKDFVHAGVTHKLHRLLKPS